MSIALKPADWEKSLTAGVQVGERCPNCGGFHGGRSFEVLLRRRQDVQVNGFLIAPDRILISDPLLPAGEIAAITAENVPAAIEKIFIDEAALLLRAEKPLTALRPAPVEPGQTPALAFQIKESADLRLYADSKPLAALTALLPDATACLQFDGLTQLQSADGNVAGYTAARTSRPGTPTIDPAHWRSITPAEFAAAEKRALEQAARSVFPVTLSFRPPPKDAPTSRYSSDDDADAGELHLAGLLISEKRLLIFLPMKRELTARLERITVTLPGGKTEEAAFIATLSTLGALVAELKNPHPEGMLPVKEPGSDDIGRLHILVDTQSGTPGTLHNRTHAARLAGIANSIRDFRVADFSGSNAGDLFFNLEGNCLWVSLPVSDISSEKNAREVNIPATLLPTFADPAGGDVNAVLVPRDKEEEKRFAWLGLDLQALTPDLAEANGVEKQTGLGEFGAIVSHVYPDSPAAKAGVEPGWVLSRIRYPGAPTPDEITLDPERSNYRYRSSFGYMVDDHDDDTPPWPPFNTPFRLKLTEIAAPGATLQAEFFNAGAPIVKTLTVETAPLWFGNAKIMTWKRAGLTLCNLTADVREHFNLAPDAPGVVVKRVKPGTPAAIAGIKAFELITQVDGAPVRNVAAFTLAVRGKTGFTFNVSRAEKERVVTLNLSDKETETSTEETGE